MNISHRTFVILSIIFGVLAVALFPIWPYTRWGYFPSLILAALVALMFTLKKLAA